MKALRRPGRLAPFGFIVLGSANTGGAIVAISLQAAYEGGNTIDESGEALPVEISNGAAAVAALMQLTTTANALAIAIQQGALQEQHAIEATMVAESQGYAGLNVRVETFNALLVRLHQTVIDAESYMYGAGLLFGSGASATDLPEVRIEGGSPGVGGEASPDLRINTGAAAPGALCGAISVGFDCYGDVDGGFRLEPDTGRMRLRVHQIDVSGGEDPEAVRTGTLRLHNLSADEEGNQPSPEDGDVHYRTEQVGAQELNKGFRAFRDGAYGLIGRGYQLPFADGSLSGGYLSVPHNLDTLAPIVCVYNGSGELVPPGPTTYNVTTADGNNFDLGIDASQLPISGTWYVTVMGF